MRTIINNLRSRFKKNKPVFIVAEIGKNFIQTEKDQAVSIYLANAKRLVDEAKKAGADAVKFQTHNVEDEQLDVKVISPHFKDIDRFKWVTRNALATPIDKFWRPLKDYCDKRGIIFFSTPMSRGAAQILQDLGVGLWKVGSGDILDFVMLDYLARTGKPIILSSGMSTLGEIRKSLNFLQKRSKNIILLHCVSKYPCLPDELNLGTINFFRKKFKIPIGFSDHSLSIEPAIVAVALGARIIEKHFSFDRNLWGSDHKASLIPEEFKKMVAGIRKLETSRNERRKYLANEIVGKYLGRTAKILQDGESIFRPFFRKTLVAASDIKKGTKLTAEMLYAMRPWKFNGGLPSENYEKIIGKKMAKNLKKFEPFKLDCFES